MLLLEVRSHLKDKAGLIFILSKLENEDKRISKNDELLKEKKLGDILQGKFKDSYKNVAHKVILAFIWINK